MEDYTEDKNTKMTTGLFSSRTEEWATPQYVFDELNREFDFDLDVCATEENKKCEEFISKQTNALTVDWYREGSRNVCWMNPPYGKQIYDFMGKAHKEALKGCTVVCLVHSRTDTRWFHEWAMKADEIRLVKGRLCFGDGKQTAPFPSCIVIFRKKEEGSLKVSSVSFNKNNTNLYKLAI